MKSKALFNRGICKNLLWRCWPIWTIYLALLLFMLPASLHSNHGYIQRLDCFALQSATKMVFLSFFMGIALAMAMFSYLYNPKSCGLINALPVRRETTFITAYLTGLVPLLLADVLVMLITALFFLPGGLLSFSSLLTWLAIAVMSNVAFFGFGVFCAMLTGSIVVLPLVYAVLNLTAYVAERCIRALLSIFVFGMPGFDVSFGWLSPVYYLIENMYVKTIGPELWQVQAVGALGIYCAVAVALSGIALLLYRRRNMETATDVVAVPILKPVFKYCLSFGCAVVFSSCVCNWFFPNVFTGFARALFALLFILIGAFLGYFAAEMLMQKTLRVFGGKWRGCILICCILAALTICFELDVFGYERHIPEPAQIEEVSLSNWSGKYSQEENLEYIVQLHSRILEHKQLHENAQETYPLSIRYTLSDGKSLTRVYSIDASQQAQNDPDSDIMLLQRILNLQEAIDRRTASSVPVSETTIDYFTIDAFTVDKLGNYDNQQIILSPQQAVEFYEQCLLPDIQEGSVDLIWLFNTEEYYETSTNTSVQIELTQRSYTPAGEAKTPESAYFYFNLTVNAHRCLQWIEENTQLNVLPMSQASPPQEYQDGSLYS